MNDTATAAPEATPADLAAAAVMTWRGAVMTGMQARYIGDLLSDADDTGNGTAVRALAVHWAGPVLDVIRARQADGTLPADVLALAISGGPMGGLLLDAMVDAGVPAPDCEAAEALIAEIAELVIRRMCAERAGLAVGGLNRILAALDPAEPGQARLADRIAELLGAGVAEPGGIGFVLS